MDLPDGYTTRDFLVFYIFFMIIMVEQQQEIQHIKGESKEADRGEEEPIIKV